MKKNHKKAFIATAIFSRSSIKSLSPLSQSDQSPRFGTWLMIFRKSIITPSENGKEIKCALHNLNRGNRVATHHPPNPA